MEISFCLLPWVGFIVLSLFLIKAHFEFNHHWTMCRKEIEEGRKKEKGRRKDRNLERWRRRRASDEEATEKARVKWRGHREGRSLCLNNGKLFMGNGWKYISALDCWQHIYWENSSYYSTMSVQQVHNARFHFPFLQKLISSQSSFRSPLVGQKAAIPSTLHYSFSFQSSSGFLTVFISLQGL